MHTHTQTHILSDPLKLTVLCSSISLADTQNFRSDGVHSVVVLVLQSVAIQSCYLNQRYLQGWGRGGDELLKIQNISQGRGWKWWWRWWWWWWCFATMGLHFTKGSALGTLWHSEYLRFCYYATEVRMRKKEWAKNIWQDNIKSLHSHRASPHQPEVSVRGYSWSWSLYEASRIERLSSPKVSPE